MKATAVSLISICCLLAQRAYISLAAADAAAGCGEQLGHFALSQHRHLPGALHVSLCLGLGVKDFLAVSPQPLVRVCQGICITVLLRGGQGVFTLCCIKIRS